MEFSVIKNCKGNNKIQNNERNQKKNQFQTSTEKSVLIDTSTI